MLGSDSFEMRKFLYSLIDWSGVQSVLDLGCGDGQDVFEMAAFTPRDVTFTAVDSSDKKIESAKSNVRNSDRITFIKHDISAAFPFAKGEFDLVFSSNLLECIPNQDLFLREIHRVLKDRGQLVCAHFDWDSQLLNGTNKALIRKAVHAFADWQQPWMQACDGWMGRRLLPTISATSLFKGQLLSYVLTNTKYESPFYGWARVQDFSLLPEQGLLDASEHQELIADVEATAAKNQYFYSINMYAYSGRTLSPKSS